MTIAAQFLIQNENGTFPELSLIDPSKKIRIEHSSWTTTDMGNGFVMETFILFLNDTPLNMQTNIKLLRNHLNLAHELYISGNPHERVRVFERLTDETTGRSSTIIGGTVTPLPDSVITREHKRNAARYAVTIERHELWESTSSIAHAESSLSSHGGYFTLPLTFNQGVQNGRIKTMMITGGGSVRTKKFWAGIKTARTSLSGFDPEIEIEEGKVGLTDGFSAWATDDTSVTGFLGDGEGVQVHFSSGTSWGQALRIWLMNFNASTTEANRPQYHGKYHLISRYRTDGDQGETFGIRAGYGWRDNPDAVKLDEYYVSSTDGNFRYIDLGVIDIGGDGFSYEVIQRTRLRQFGITLHATVIDNDTDALDGSNTSFIYFDNMWLVPAEQFMYAELETEIGGADADKRVEIYTAEDDSVYGAIIERDDTDILGRPAVNKQQVYETVKTIESDNWSMPTAENSVLVFVADSDIGTLYKTATVRMQLEVLTRTVGA